MFEVIKGYILSFIIIAIIILILTFWVCKRIPTNLGDVGYCLLNGVKKIISLLWSLIKFIISKF